MPPPLPGSQDTTPSYHPQGHGLSLSLLTAASLAKLDKSRHLKDYISSQRTYRNHFVQEGRKDWAAWGKSGDSANVDSRTEGTERECKIQDAGFGTPELKARVPNPPRKAGVPRQHKGVLQEPSSEGVEEPAVTEEQRRKGASKERRKRTKKDEPVPGSRSPSTLRKYVNTKKNPTQKGSTRKRHRSVGSDREAVLANRRERRREKKAIVNQRKPDSDAETNVDEPEDSRNKKSNKKDKKGLAAGLALMHGFSASNVGPGRLTLKPSYGMFQKGKASAKTRVSKIKRPSVGAWSEFEFLGKAGDNRQEEVRIKRRSRSVDDARSESKSRSSDSTSKHSNPPKKKFKISNYEHKQRPNGHKKSKRCHQPEERSATEDVNDTTEDSLTRVTPRGRSEHRDRAESVVWDIEQDVDVEQVQDQESFSRGSATNIPTHNGTLILDTSTKWDLGRPEEQKERSVLEGPSHVTVAEDNDSRSRMSYASLCPSHSASQVGRRIALGSQDPEPVPTRSKYFGRNASRLDKPEKADSSETEVIAAVEDRTRITLPGRMMTPSPPPITHISSEHTDERQLSNRGDQNPVQSGFDAEDVNDSERPTLPGQLPREEPGKPVSLRTMLEHRAPQSYSGFRDFRPFIPASALPRHYSSDDEMTDLEELLNDSQAGTRQDLIPAGSRASGDFLSANRPSRHTFEEPMDDEFSDEAFGSAYDHDTQEYVQEAPIFGVMDDEVLEEYAVQDYAQYYDESEERMEIALDSHWTAEDAELGPPLYDNAETHADLRVPPGQIYTDDMVLLPDNYADGDVPWDSDADFTPMDETTVEIYAEEFPPASEMMESTSTSLSGAASNTETFCEGPALLRRRAEIGWTDMTQEETVRYPTVSKVEEDVAKGLRNHWLPQRL